MKFIRLLDEDEEDTYICIALGLGEANVQYGTSIEILEIAA